MIGQTTLDDELTLPTDAEPNPVNNQVSRMRELHDLREGNEVQPRRDGGLPPEVVQEVLFEILDGIVDGNAD